MTYGPKQCARCGSIEGIEAHHLSEGCPSDLTVWFCHTCHGRVHGQMHRMNL